MAIIPSADLKARLEAMPATKAMKALLAYQWGDNVVRVIDQGQLDIDCDGNFFCNFTMVLKESVNIIDPVVWHCNMKDGEIIYVFAVHERKGYYIGKFGKPGTEDLWRTE